MNYEEIAAYTVHAIILIAAIALAVAWVLNSAPRSDVHDVDDLIYEDPSPQAPVVLVRTRAPLTAEETRRIALAWQHEKSREMIEDAFDTFHADALAGCTRDNLTPDQRAFAAGALDAVYRFRAHVLSLHEEEAKPRR